MRPSTNYNFEPCECSRGGCNLLELGWVVETDVNGEAAQADTIGEQQLKHTQSELKATQWGGGGGGGGKANEEVAE